MSLDISPVSLSSAVPVSDVPSASFRQSNQKVAPPPPPPPPPPPQDAVQLSLSADILKLQHEGKSTIQISQTLGLPVQTISIYLGSSLIEAALASAPTIPETLSR